MEIDKTVEIMGVRYKITDASLETNLLGQCDHLRKMLLIDVDQIKDVMGKGWKEEVKHTIRHEIIHAYLYESGMTGMVSWEGAYWQNELITDWMAVQYPKIVQTFKETGCL